MSELAFEDPRAVLRRHGLDPKRSWGQNFLVDRRFHERIVAAARVGPGDRVIEIGAGLGTLTARLLTTGAQVIAVERDRDLAAVLREELGLVEGFSLAEANALTFDYAAAAAGSPATVVGNLPYQIASPILFCLLEARAAIRRIVIMLQREVAERIVASPGTKAYGALSLLVQLYAAASIAFRVPPGAFYPPPRVLSAVVVLTPSIAPRVQVESAERLRALVNAAFGMRRKTLWNSLREGLEPGLSEAALAGALERAAIDPRRRGETLSLEEFAALERAIAERVPGA